MHHQVPYVPTQHVPVSKASAELSKHCRDVSHQQTPIVITNHKKPLAAIVPLTYLQNQNSLKIKAPAAFEFIGQFVCKINTGPKSCSGIIFEKNIIAVPWHALLLKEKGFVKQITVCYGGQEYIANWYSYASEGDEFVNLYDCAYHDICFFQIQGPSKQGIAFPDTPALQIDNGPAENDLSPGEKVFCAYYLDDELTYHEGKVSSVDDKKQTSFFSVDLSIVPQSSGGVVFVNRFGSLRFLGLIIAQYANIQKVFADAKTFLEAQEGQAPKDDLYTYINALADTVFDNMATGIAKVVHAKHLSAMSLELQSCCSCDDDSEGHRISFLRSPMGLMPTAKQEAIGAKSGTESVEGKEQSYNITCTGIGNGKVKITYSIDRSFKVIEYKFKKPDGNRHELKKYDNASRQILSGFYQEMADSFDVARQVQNKTPETFNTSDFVLTFYQEKVFNKK